MHSTKSLLVELFIEELPPKALKKLGESFAQTLLHSLKSQGLTGEHATVTPFATPRRLAAHVSAVHAQATDRKLTHKLMPVAVALDAEGRATPALLKKMAALGADPGIVSQLERRPEGKAETLFWTTSERGATLAAGLQCALDAALAALPIPKVMSYQLADGWTSVHFVRPVHGLVALHGADVVPVTVLGLVAGRATRGHRFEAGMDPVVLQDADHYAQQLESQGAVMAGFAHRRTEIVRQLKHAAAKSPDVPSVLKLSTHHSPVEVRLMLARHPAASSIATMLNERYADWWCARRWTVPVTAPSAPANSAPAVRCPPGSGANASAAAPTARAAIVAQTDAFASAPTPGLAQTTRHRPPGRRRDGTDATASAASSSIATTIAAITHSGSNTTCRP
jgi:hypothetical protein